MGLKDEKQKQVGLLRFRRKYNKRIEFVTNCLSQTVQTTVDVIPKPNIWSERWPNVSCYYVQSVLAISSVLSDSILWLTARNVTSSCPVAVDRRRARGARASSHVRRTHPAVTGRAARPHYSIRSLTPALWPYANLSTEAERLSRPSFTIRDNKLCCALIGLGSPRQVWTGEPASGMTRQPTYAVFKNWFDRTFTQ